jgi:uncharacterized protein (DUF433 family)
MRISVEDILRWLAYGMDYQEILENYPELTKEDILTALEFSADRQNLIVVAA